MSDFINKLNFDCDDNECCIGRRTDTNIEAATGITDVNYQGNAIIP